MKPKVTIITVCYNAINGLEKTLESVIAQTWDCLEYIVIDGGSTDGSLDVLEKYKHHVDCLVSERDKGVYDAMNKGVRIAHGEWVLFMNAGDVFHDEMVVEKMFQDRNLNGVSILFGDTECVFTNGNRLVKYGDYKIHQIMPSCHQSIFCRRELLVSHPFDLKYKVRADLDFFCKMKKKECPIMYVPIVLSIFDRREGISTDFKKAKKEYFQILYPPVVADTLYWAYLLGRKTKRFLWKWVGSNHH